MRFLRRATRVDDMNSIWITGSQRKISIAHASKERAIFLLEAVLIFCLTTLVRPVAAAGAVHARARIVIEQDGEVRLQPAAKHVVQYQHGLRAQFAAAALVSLGRIGVAIAKHDMPFRQRWQYHFMQMLRTRGKHQGHLGQGRQSRSRRMQQHFADLLSGRGAAGFARNRNGDSMGTQRAGQFGQLGALAAAVQPFERNESSALGHAGNDISATGLWSVGTKMPRRLQASFRSNRTIRTTRYNGDSGPGNCTAATSPGPGVHTSRQR